MTTTRVLTETEHGSGDRRQPGDGDADLPVVTTVGIYLTEQERRYVTNVLNDLQVREHAAIRACEGPEAQTYAAEYAALKKLMHLPAACNALGNEDIYGRVHSAV